MSEDADAESGWADLFFKPVAVVPLFAIAASTGIVLFAPDHFLTRLGLLDIRDRYRLWIGPAFLLVSCYVIGAICWSTWNFAVDEVKRTRRRRLFRARVQEHMATLTPAEIDVLNVFVRNHQRTAKLDSNDPAVMSLSAVGIIHAPRQHTIAQQAYDSDHLEVPLTFHINPHVWTQLRTNDDQS